MVYRGTTNISHTADAPSVHSTPMYNKVGKLSLSQIHPMPTNKGLLYYYLLMNNHTNRYDTITASSPEELQKKVDDLTDPDWDTTTIVIFSILGVIILVFLGAVFFGKK